MSRTGLLSALVVAGLGAFSATALAEDASAPAPHHQQLDMAAMHKRMCTERKAHQAGRLGYLAAKLSLTSSQQPLWNDYAKAVMASAELEQKACLQEPAPGPAMKPTVLEQRQREVRLLEARLQAIRSEQPSLEKLYAALTPEQKTAMDESMHHGRHPGMDGWMRDNGMMGGDHRDMGRGKPDHRMPM